MPTLPGNITSKVLKYLAEEEEEEDEEGSFRVWFLLLQYLL